MENEHVKTLLMAAWTLGIGVVGYAAGVSSLAAWTVLVVVACAPPLVLLRLWRAPAQSMSESIRRALR